MAGEGRVGRATRAFDGVLVAATVVALVDPLRFVSETAALLTEAVWTVLALVYVVVRLRRLRRARRGDGGWPDRLSGPRTLTALAILAALQLLGSGLEVVGAPLEGVVDEDARAFFIVVVLVAWLVLHLSYADRYWRAALGADGCAIEFPGTAAPGPVEFTYFSLAIGTTFAVPDATVRRTAIRSLVMWHGVLSFVANTVILGVIVGLLTDG